MKLSIYVYLSISMVTGFEHWQSNELPFSNFSSKRGIGSKKTLCHIGHCLCERQDHSPRNSWSVFFFSFSCHLGCREASDQPWSSVSGRNKTRGSCLGSHHYPWEDHGPVSRCSKICQDAVLGKTTWLSTLRYCHCGYPECEGILLFLCHPSLAS